jgi:hypothetical protein
MSEFRHLDTEAPALMGDVVEAVLRLSTFSERQILDLVSDGQLGERFPFHPKAQEMPPDFVAEDDLEEASPLPLSRQQRAALIQSSMPPAKKANAERDRLAAALAWQEQAQRLSEE